MFLATITLAEPEHIPCKSYRDYRGRLSSLRVTPPSLFDYISAYSCTGIIDTTQGPPQVQTC